MENKSFVALDLETTGLDFEKDEIIEVALVRFENGVESESVDYLVKPVNAQLRPFIENLTGIYNADIENAEPFAAVAQKIYSFIGDLPIVAHNAMFDSKFLKQTFAKVGISFENHPVWDSLTVSRIAYQNVPNHRLDTLVQELGIERSRAHRALPDAIACGELFVMAIDKIQNSDPWLVDALARIARGSDWSLLWKESEPASELPAYRLPDVPLEDVPVKERAPRVSEFFKEGGLLSTKIENYQVRHNQQDFASVVERNMHKGGLCVLEAPTGSGKSLAYLASAACKAVSGERVVISTATRALQEQLWKKDIPLVKGLFDGKLKPAVLKGRENYLCLRKFEEVLNAPANLLLPDERDSFMAIVPWVFSTETGDVNECNSFSQVRNRVLWSKISSSAKSCLGEKCPHYIKCPAMAAKRRAMNSNLLLVNHSLFLADMSVDFALLPLYEHIVFDEAHKLPQVSRQAFGRTVSFFALRNIVKTLVPSRGPSGLNSDGLLSEIQVRIPATETELLALCVNLSETLMETEKALHRFFMKIGKKLAKQKNQRNGFTYVSGIMAEYDADPAAFLEQGQNALKLSENLGASLAAQKPLAGLLSDLNGRMTELSRFLQDFEFLVKAGREDWTFFMEDPFNPHTIKLHACPLEASSPWKEKFYPWIKSATFTSATLSVQGDLTYYVQKMGMPLDGKKAPFLRVYSDSTSKDDRCSMIVAKYLPKPSVPEYNDAVNETLCAVLPEVEENTMVLFTSISAMMKAQAALAPIFAERNKLLLCQHVDGALDGLVAMFRKSRGACLLGCQSLWEGVDFPGDALKLLVIPKLPFPNPVDPLVAGIVNKLKAEGKNAFKEFFVPEAYMELRQGLGRLIRSDEDSGKVLILDNRVVLEHYGKTFVRIWNNRQTVVNSVEEIMSALK
ncbi:helicase C-terminal domain-containing protein [Fibrobacter sp.]|uniref:helicase C-terminal domain-containing protein n=1 Tax=Fibrobacter sp. TaxID=35828 RepID=UPI0038909091